MNLIDPNQPVNYPIERVLREIYKEINKYNDLSKEELYTLCINKKLAETLKNYNEQVDATSTYLIRRSSARVLKAITKKQKRKDKEIILENTKKKKEEESDE